MPIITYPNYKWSSYSQRLISLVFSKKEKKKDFSERFVTHFAQQVKKWGFVVQFSRRDSIKPRQIRSRFILLKKIDRK